MVLEAQKSITAQEFDTWVELPENSQQLFELISGEIIERMPSKFQIGNCRYFSTRTCLTHYQNLPQRIFMSTIRGSGNLASVLRTFDD